MRGSAQKSLAEVLGAKPVGAIRTLFQYKFPAGRRVTKRIASPLPSNPQPETNNACELEGSSPMIVYGFKPPNKAVRSLLGSGVRWVFGPMELFCNCWTARSGVLENPSDCHNP